MGTDHCVECSRKVTTKQHVLQCDSCSLWQHRVCNTGWHTRINSDIGKANAAFYVLVPALHREAKLVVLTVRLVSEEQVIRIQRTRYKELEGRLHQLWDQYTEGDITASHLLRDCGNIYGPSTD